MTHFGSAIWSNTRRSTGAWRWVMVPTTSRRSDCLGVKRGKVKPKRSVSKRGPVTDMYSMPQQAVTNGYWKNANFLAQASMLSYRDVKNESRRSAPPWRPSGLRKSSRFSTVMLSSACDCPSARRQGRGRRWPRSLLGHALCEVWLVDNHARPPGSLGGIAVGRAPEFARLGVHARLATVHHASQPDPSVHRDRTAALRTGEVRHAGSQLSSRSRWQASSRLKDRSPLHPRCLTIASFPTGCHMSHRSARRGRRAPDAGGVAGRAAVVGRVAVGGTTGARPAAWGASRPWKRGRWNRGPG